MNGLIFFWIANTALWAGVLTGEILGDFWASWAAGFLAFSLCCFLVYLGMSLVKKVQ